jgi:hypothetical protein
LKPDHGTGYVRLLEGGDLAAWLKQRGALPIEKAVLAALPFVAEAMDFRKKSIAAGLGDPLETLVPKDGPLWPEAKVRGRS